MPLQVGDQVYVRRSLLGLEDDDISPFYRTNIRARQDRSVQVDKPDGSLSEPIAISKIATNFGVLIVRIGDFNEDGLLDPLAKSVLHYCRMLLPSDSVRLIELRTELELVALWEKVHGICQQVVLVGHGGPSGFLFGEEEVNPERLANIISGPNPTPKEFISLGCQTGVAGFGKAFSSSPRASHFIAPFHSVRGCVASLFTQTYLNERLLASYSPKVAFNHARDDLLGAVSFRLWQNGTLAAGPA
jgi:hypothetical protein